MALRSRRTPMAAVFCLALASTACGGDGGEATATTAPIDLETTTTTLPPEPVFVVATEGESGPAVRAVQFLLVCNGYQQTVVDGLDQTLVPDGTYGRITSTIVDRVQRDLGLPRDGSQVDADLYEMLAGTCDNTRSVYVGPTQLSVEAGGYVSPERPDTWTIWAQEGQRLTLTPAEGPLRMGLYAADGTEIVPLEETESIAVDVGTSGTHTVQVFSDEPMTYRVTLGLPPHHSVLLLQSTGLDYVAFGDRPPRVLELVSAVIGDPTADTGWIEASEGCVRWRRVEWGNAELWLFFTDAATDAAGKRTYGAEGVEHFAAWQMNLAPAGTGTMPPLATPSGLGVGDPAAAVADVYGSRAEVDGVLISIVDGIILGELDEPGGVVKWLRSGATLCLPNGEENGDDEGDDPS
jgi:peptidoglycan hydrolase-like protein with peptidoglycan-binding domain